MTGPRDGDGIPVFHPGTPPPLIPMGCTVQRPNTWTKTRQKFSSLLFTVTSTALPEISISSNSRNLLEVLQFSYCTL
jgi:hypothetical protein